MDSCDVFVIGSTPARHLASSGKCVLLLQRGDWLLGSRRPGAHQAGACRFGTDPVTSALNID
jgi:hypothetical protein